MYNDQFGPVVNRSCEQCTRCDPVNTLYADDLYRRGFAEHRSRRYMVKQCDQCAAAEAADDAKIEAIGEPQV